MVNNKYVPFLFLLFLQPPTIQKLKEENVCEPNEVTKIELSDVTKVTE